MAINWRCFGCRKQYCGMDGHCVICRKMQPAQSMHPEQRPDKVTQADRNEELARQTNVTNISREPTEEMLLAAFSENGTDDNTLARSLYRDIWRAMYDAASAAPSNVGR